MLLVLRAYVYGIQIFAKNEGLEKRLLAPAGSGKTYNDDKLKDLYHRAELEANRGFVDTRKYPYLDKELFYLRENMTVLMMKHLSLQGPERRWGGSQIEPG